MQPNNWNLKTMGFKFFTFHHTCFKSERKGRIWHGWLPVERLQVAARQRRHRQWRWRSALAVKTGQRKKQRWWRAPSQEQGQRRRGVVGASTAVRNGGGRPVLVADLAEQSERWNRGNETGEREVWLAHVVVWKKRSRRVWGIWELTG